MINFLNSYRWIYHSIALNEANSMVQSAIENIKNWWRYSWFCSQNIYYSSSIEHSSPNISTNTSPIPTGVGSLDLSHWALFNNLFIDKFQWEIDGFEGVGLFIYTRVNLLYYALSPWLLGIFLLMNRLLYRSQWGKSNDITPVGIGLELMKILKVEWVIYLNIGFRAI